jgi:MFS family permease
MAATPARAPGTPPGSTSIWAPFHNRVFAVLWTATVISNIGAWLYSTASAWLMTSLNPAPIIVSLIQVAASLPLFIFAIPAGALADIVDKRRLLIGVECLISALAIIFAVLAWLHFVAPDTLLLFTFLLGVGNALESPPWQAIVPQLVPKRDLTPALAANGVGVNVSRAVGPALGGAMIAAWGIMAPFWINAVANLGVIATLVWWRPARAPRGLPAERFVGATITGLRYAKYSPSLRAAFIRAVAFFFFASADWALLPLVARQRMAGGPELYGILLGAIGAGAMAAAAVVPWLRNRLGSDRSISVGMASTAAALVLLAVARTPLLGVAAGLLAGAAWTAAITNLSVAAQLAVPDWVRARGLALFTTVFFGSMTVGSALWGQLASAYGLPASYLVAAVGALVAIPVAQRWHLGTDPGLLDLSPSRHWQAPVVAAGVDPDHDRGPVLVTVEYHVERGHRTAFLHAMERLALERRRDGAYAWGVFEDTVAEGRFLETFLIGSWLEHLRQHDRVTQTDRALQDAIHQMMADGAKVITTHFIAPGPAPRE